MADEADVRNWAAKMYRGERLDSTERQKVVDTIQQAGREGKIVGHIAANGRRPNGVSKLPREKD